VFLDVSSGKYSASDRIVAKVIANEIFISELKTGVDSFVEISNPSAVEINLSGWRIRCGLQTFTFSANSFIRPKSYLVISAASSGIILPEGAGAVELLYPGEFIADSLSYGGNLLAGQSFSRESAAAAAVIADETPGLANTKLKKAALPVKSVTVETKSAVSAPVQLSKQEQPVIAPEQAEENFSQETQPANVIAAVEPAAAGSKTVYYFLAVLGLAGFAGAGVFFIRRKGGV